MIIGYARVSTADQNLDMQRSTLEAAGCERIYEEKASGAKDARPVLNEMLRNLRSGDTLVVWKLDRMSRSLLHMIRTGAELDARGVMLRSLTEGVVDSTTPMGKAMFAIFGVFAQLERDTTVERIRTGVAEARKRGVLGGNKPKLSREEMREVRALYDAQKRSVGWIARKYRVSRRTVYRALEQVPSTEATPAP